MNAITKRTERFLETKIDDEIVVMELGKGEFFSLTGTGLAIWQLIDGTRDPAALVEALRHEFNAAPGELAGDVEEFLAKLRDAGLIATD